MKRTDLGWECRAPTISQLMRDAIMGHLTVPNPDAVLNIETHLFNTTLYADSCVYDMDLGKDVWLNQGRWSRLIKEYVPLEALERFMSQAIEILTGEARDGATANMMFRDPERYNKKHRWGGCLMGATFRGDARKAGKPTITFYSRTTYIGYMGLLDAGIAAVMARTICSRLTGISPADIAFRWHLSSQQLHAFKTLPYVYSQPKLLALVKEAKVQQRDELPPTLYHMGKWYQKVVTGWQLAKAEGMTPEAWLLTEKYGPFRRIKRRWLESQKILLKNLPPSCPIQSLTFDKAE